MANRYPYSNRSVSTDGTVVALRFNTNRSYAVGEVIGDCGGVSYALPFFRNISSMAAIYESLAAWRKAIAWGVK